MSLRLRLLARPGDADLVQALLESDPGYTERVTGLPVGGSDGLSTLTMAPPGTSSEDKHVLGLLEDDRLVGLVDVVRGYPGPDRAFVGLLLTRPDRRGTGLAAMLHGAALDLARGWPDVTATRLAVVQSNAQVEPFWQQLGYVATGEEKPWDYDGFRSVSRLFERPLERPRRPPDLPCGPGWVIDGGTLLSRVTDAAAFREGLAQDPLVDALEALFSGDPATARELLSAAEPTVRVRALLADCARDLGDTARAVREYADLLAEQAGSPWEPVLRQHHGKALLADGQTERARETFETTYSVRLREGAAPDQVASSAQARDRLRGL